jgi:solute carrier family 25 oxoglutarate transporter 11
MANEKSPAPSLTTTQNGPTQHSNFIRRYIPTAAMPFVIGGSSGIVATICIQPIDMVKVRLQLAASEKGAVRPSPITVARDIVAKNGVLGLYDGLSAGLLRQVVYGTARLGLFFTFEGMLKERAEKLGRNLTFLERVSTDFWVSSYLALEGFVREQPHRTIIKTLSYI